MKKLLLSIYLTICVFGILQAQYSGGSGTSGDPYQIATLDDLLELSNTTTDWDKHFIQTADIDASATTGWNSGKGFIPIGLTPPFTGSYNGNGFVIDRLYINDPGGYGGLFRKTEGATISNLGLTNYNISISQQGGAFAHIMIGGSISNCYGTGSFNASDAAGLAYMIKGDISVTDCYNEATINGYQFVGGLITFVGDGTAGDNISITNCYNNGTVNKITASYSHESGGFIAGVDSPGSVIIDFCYNTGNVIGNDYAGGFIGSVKIDHANSKITRCYNTGSVQGRRYVGGFIGNLGTNYGIIENCYSTGSVTASYDFAGGFTGYSNYPDRYKNCYSTGSVSNSTNRGGFMAGWWDYAVSAPTSCFWDTQTSGDATSNGGVGKTTAEMKTLSTFTDAGWDFVGETTNGSEDIWDIDAGVNNGYPFLRISGPVISVEGNGNVIANKDNSPSTTDHTDFGSTGLNGGTIERTYTIQNTGNENLTVSSVNISGTHASNFSVSASPASTVVPGSSTTFRIVFDPSELGVRAASVSITNDDGDENPYNFSIQGTGTNIAPTAASFTASPGPYQDLVYTFTTTTFSYSDGDNDPIDHVRVTAIPGSGTLYVDANNNDTYNSGEQLSNGAQVSKADLDAGNLQFYTTATSNTSFTFDVNDGNEYSASTYTATLNITPVPTVTLSLGGNSINETGGSTNVTATLSNAYGATVTTSLAFSGTATLTNDFTRTGSAITISSGTTGSITISSVHDLIDESNETIIIDINNVTNGTENGTQQQTISITDDDTSPTVSTTAITTFDGTSATMGGNVTAEGTSSVTERGVVYSSIDNTPEIGETNVTKDANGTNGAGTYNESISNLSPVTTYYVQAYAISAAGTSYGGIQNFTTGKATQTITFNALPSVTYGDSDFHPGASASSGLPVSYSSSNQDVAIINGGLIQIVGAGTCTIYADQGGNATYNAAPQVSRTLIVDPKELTISGASASNKVYDGTTAATISGTVALSGLVSGDDVTLGGTPIATFASADVASSIAVTVSGYSISGAEAGNYSLTQPTGLTADIAAKTLTITGITANNKTYDSTTDATISGTAALSGLVSGDDVTLGGTPTATFASADVASSIAVTVSGYSISGAEAGNYSLTQPTGLTADIAAKTLTITGLTANNKTYDGTTAAALSGTASLSGVISGDDVTLGGMPTATFANAGVASSIAVTVSGYSISGAEAGNYTLTQPTGLTADIAAKTLTITGLTANNKTYDGTTAAALSGTASLSGVVSGDDVTLGGTPTATFASADVATGISVTVTGYSLSGADAGNYTLTQPTGLSADITPKALTITADDQSKTYDGSVFSPFTVTYSGFISGEDENDLGGTLVFSGTSTTAVNVGTGYVITPQGLTSSNYNISFVNGSLDITQKALTVTADDQSKTYDGSVFSPFTVSYSGFISGEDENNLGGTLAFSGTATTATNVGTGYVITPQGLTSPNYDISFVNGSLDITQKALTVTADGQSKTYDGTVFSPFTVSYSGFISGEDENNLNGVLTFSGTATTATNVGTGYVITPQGLTSPNYSISFVNGSLDIIQKALTVTADDQSKVYDGSVFSPFTVTYSGFISGEDENDLGGTLSFSGAATTATNVGTGYVITPGGLTSPNYNISFINGSLDITQKALTITADDQSKTYDGSVFSPFTVSYSGFENGEDATNLGGTLSFTGTATTATEVGSGYVIIPGGLTSANYNITFVNGTLGITQKALTIIANDQSKVYDGTVFSLFTVTYSGFISGEDENDLGGTLAFSGTATTATNVGTGYVITPGGLTSPNYNISFINGSLDIIQKALTVTADDQSKTYDGTVFSPFTVTYSGFISGEDENDLGGTLVFSGTSTTAVNVGTGYVITPQGLTSSNYNISFVNGSLDITQKALTVTADDQSKTYDGSVFSPFTVSYSDFATGENATNLGGTLAFSGTATTATDVGTGYVITPGGLTSSNYNISFVNGSLDITQKELTVTADDKSKTYDGTVFSPFTVAYSGFATGEGENDLGGTLVFSGTSTTAVNVGTGYVITPQGLTSSNYNISFVNGSLDITQKALTVTADGQSKTYDGSVFSPFTVSYSGFATGEDENDLGGTLSFSGTATTATNVGTGYVITPGGLTSPNYDISFVNGSLDITQKALTIIADDKTKVYDGIVFSPFTVTYSGFISGEDENDLGGTLSFSGTATTATNVGTGYVITPGGLTSPNYNISFVNGSLDITQKALTVTADDQSKVYDGTVFSPFTVTYSGFISGEDENNLNGVLTFSGTATTAINVGTGYVITPGGLTSSNYNISFVNGNLDITQKALTVTADDQSKTYDGSVFSPFTVSYSGFISGEDENNLNGVLTFSGTATTATNVGTGYVITPGGLTSSNYNITFVNGTLGITQKALTIIANDKTKVYDGIVFSPFTVSYSGFATGENATNLGGTLAFSGTATTATNVGTGYVITPQGLTSPNYDISFENGELEITPKPINITGTVTSNKVYDGTTSTSLSGSILSGIIGSDIVILDNTTIGTFTQSSAGIGIEVTTAMTISGADSGNYTLIQPSGLSANITPKALTITADDQSKVYDGTVFSPFTVSCSGFVIGEDETNLNGVLTFSGTATTATSVGTGYIITPSGLSSTNYDIEFVDGVLNIILFIAGDTNGDGEITEPEIAGDTNGDGEITEPEIAGDTNGDGEITEPEIAGDTNGDGEITEPEIAGDTNGDGEITEPEIAGDTNGDGEITEPEIAGDTNGDGEITEPEIAGDTNGDGEITEPEIAGDTNGDGEITEPEIAGDTNGDGEITEPEIAGDTNGDGEITEPEIAGDTNGDGEITDPEVAGDTNGDGKITEPEIAGDTNGDGEITEPEVAGDTNGDGEITEPEIAGDTNGDGEITEPEIAGDTNGDGEITEPEVAGDTNGDGEITEPEIAGDTNGDGEITEPEIAGDTNGDGEITEPEVAGDTNGDGKIGKGENRTIDPNKDHKNIQYLFSPNGDGFNDYWKIPDILDLGRVSVKIYDRWGTLLYESTNYQNDWDGTSKGKQVPEGAYIYFIKTELQGTKTGMVNLVR